MKRYFANPEDEHAFNAAKDGTGTHPPISTVAIKKPDEVPEGEGISLDDIVGPANLDVINPESVVTPEAAPKPKKRKVRGSASRTRKAPVKSGGKG